MFTTTSTISPGNQRKDLLNSSWAALPVHPGGKQAGAGLGFQPSGWSHCAPHGCPRAVPTDPLSASSSPTRRGSNAAFRAERSWACLPCFAKSGGAGGTHGRSWKAWANLLALVGQSKQSTGLALELGCSGVGAEAAGGTERRTGEQRPSGEAGRAGGGDRIAGASPFPLGRGLHRHPHTPRRCRPPPAQLTLRGPRGRGAP